MQFCDGTNWFSMKGGTVATLDALSCSNGQIAKWNNGSSIWECANDDSGGAESDPQVSAVTSGKWCRGTGSAVTCDQDAPSGADNLGSGGSTSGTLYSQNGSGYGYLGSSGTNYIRFDDVSQGNEAYVRLNGNWEYHMHPSYFRPYTDNANDLGTSSKKWQDIWAYDTMTNRICNEAGSSCKTPESLLTSESDPQVSAVTSGKWCRGTGSAVTCDQDVPNSSVPNGTLCGLAQAAGSTSCSGYTNLMTCLGINIANGTCPSGYTSKTVEFSFSTGGFNFVRLCTRTCSKM